MQSHPRYWAFLALVLSLVTGGRTWAEEGEEEPQPPFEPGLEFEFTVAPTNGSPIITLTTNVITVTIENFDRFLDVTVAGLTELGEAIDFLDDGTAPDDTADDGVFRGLLVAPSVTEWTPFLWDLTLTGTDRLSIEGEPPAEATVYVTNRLSMEYMVVTRPPNDMFTNAFKLEASGGVSLSTNEFSSLEPGEPVHAGVSGRAASVWWTWAAPADGSVLVDLSGTEFPALLGVYRGGTVSNLTTVASAGVPAAPGRSAQVTFTAVRGTTYRLAVAGADTNAVGRVRLRVAPTGTPDDRPPFVTIEEPVADTMVTGAELLVVGSAREPFPLDSGIREVLVQVNNQPMTNALGTESWSALVILPPGTNVVRAFARDFAGNLSDAASVVVRYLNPTNTYFSMARQLQGTGGLETGNTAQAIKEAGEPLHAGNDGGRSVWYWWRAPADGELVVNTSGSQLDTLLGVYAGDRLTNLVELASNDDAAVGSVWSHVSLAVFEGEVYRVALDAYGAEVGDFVLQYVFTPLLPGTFVNLTLNRAPGGTVSPPGGAYPVGARVRLTAVPESGYEFVAWEGDVVGEANPLDLTMTRSVRITPRFRPSQFTDDFETGGFSTLAWETSAPAWEVQTNVVALGQFAARSAAMGHRQSSELKLVAETGTGTGSFDVRVSTEPTWDVLEFLVDGVVIRRWSGEREWQTVTFPLAAGEHTLVWRYTKDPNFVGGLDAVFVDNVFLPPVATGGGEGDAPALSLARAPEGMLITVTGTPGVMYDIQAAPAVTGTWVTLTTLSSQSGIVNYLDLQALGLETRYYRAQVR